MLDELKMLKLQLQQTVQLTISKMRAQRRYQRMRGSSCGGRSVCQRRLMMRLRPTHRIVI